MVTRITRRAFFALATGCGLLLGTEQASAAPLGAKLEKKKIGNQYRLKIWVSVNMPPINVSNHYVGQMNVPANGQAVKQFNTDMGFQIQVLTSKLTQSDKLRVTITAKFHNVAQSIIRNI